MESCTSSAISVDEELFAPDVLDFIVIDRGVGYWYIQFLVQMFKTGPLINITWEQTLVS